MQVRRYQLQLRMGASWINSRCFDTRAEAEEWLRVNIRVSPNPHARIRSYLAPKD